MRDWLLIGIFAACCASAQAQNIPRTADGRPDFQGVWVGDFGTSLERPDDVTTLAVTAEVAKKILADVLEKPDEPYDPDSDQTYALPKNLLTMKGELRSSLIVEPADGKLPFTALGKAARSRSRDLRKYGFDNPEERPDGERCTGSLNDPPLFALGVVIPDQIIQTPGAIVIASEDTHGGHVVALSGAAPPDAVRSRVGYSAGHWEGDTLVVETDHLSADDPSGVQSRDAVLLSRASHIIERFRLLSRDELLYQFTVEDPALYARPWLAEYVLTRSSGRLYEYACHEGNYAMANILTAARAGKQLDKATDEKLKAEKKAKQEAEKAKEAARTAPAPK